MNWEGKAKKAAVTMPYLLAVIICLCISLPVLSQSVVLDEAYSILLVRGSIKEIIQGAAADVHPPLYYLILKLCSFFGGESLVKYRIVTYLAAYLNLLVLGATLIRKRWGVRTAVFYLLWFGGVYCTSDLSVLVRMYSWAAFFVTAAALHIFFYYESGRTRDYLLGILMTLAAMYTHYYAVLSVFFVWAILLAAAIVQKRVRLKGILAGGACIAAGYLPWAKALLSQAAKVRQNYWIGAIGWREWFFTPARLMDSSLSGTGLVLYFFVFVLLILALLGKKKDALLFFCVFAGTMLTGMLLSVLVRPIWQDRYLYVAWGALSLFAAIITGERVSAYSFIPQTFLSVLLCVVLVFSVQTTLQDEWMTGSDKEWVDFLNREVDQNALIIVDDPGEHHIVFEYYLPDAQIVMTERLRTEEGRDAFRSVLEAADKEQIWYMIDYRQDQLGYDKLEVILDDFGLELGTEPAAQYTIKYKTLGIFKIGEK